MPAPVLYDVEIVTANTDGPLSPLNPRSRQITSSAVVAGDVLLDHVAAELDLMDEDTILVSIEARRR